MTSKSEAKRIASLSPRGAKTFNQLCSLRRDNWSWGDWWIMSDGGTVSITQQKVGESPSQEISVPMSAFNRLIDWYNRPQEPSHDE